MGKALQKKDVQFKVSVWNLDASSLVTIKETVSIQVYNIMD